MCKLINSFCFKKNNFLYFSYFFLISLSLISQTKNDEILSLNPYLYEDFEDISSDDFFPDLTTKSNVEWVNTNRPQLINGPRGKAMNFHGVDAAFRAHSYGNYKLGNFIYSNGFSCSFWIKHLYDDSTDRNQRVFAQHNNFQITYSQGLQVMFNNAQQRVLGTEVLDGEWHHVVIVADFTKPSGNVKTYMDNVLNSTLDFNFDSGFSDSDSRRSFYVAKRDIGNNYTEVALDELGVFNRAISSYEVNQLYKINTLVDTNPIVKKLQISNGKTIMTEGTNTQTNLLASTNLTNISNVKWSVVSGEAQIQTGNNLNATISMSNGKRYQHAKVKLIVANNNHETSAFINVVRVNKKAPNVRELSSLPEAGIHPRILFGPDDLENQRQRFNNVSYIKSAMDYMLPLIRSKPIYERTSFDYMIMSYNSLMENNQSDLDAIAKDFSNFVGTINSTYKPNYDNRLVHDVDMNIGITYDFLYNNMDTNERNKVRGFIARMISNRIDYGGLAQGIELIERSGNWATFHDNIVVCAAAIEGEPGEMPDILSSNEDKIRNFLCYNGVRESGFPREGYGYYAFGMQQGIYSCIIQARRGENFFETSNFYKSIEIGLREQQPWVGGDMYSHHDGQGWGNGFYKGDPVWGAKYMFPNDKLIDCHYQTFADNFTELRKMQLATIVFGMDKIENNNDPGQIGVEMGLNTTAVDLERGIVNTRSKWGEDMVRFDFECRMDAYFTGHLHSDRNMFTLSGYGRQWISDNDYHDTKSDEHATVLIDGLAYDCGNRSAWRSAPGILMRYEDDKDYMLAQGDATFAYNYYFARNDPDKEYINKKWEEFTFPGSEIPDWKQIGPDSELGYMKKLEDVEKAIRTVVFIKGDYPFALVVDDIKKDEELHDYEWVANVPFNVSNQTEFLFDTPVKTNNKLILKYKEDLGANSPQLLVQLLESNGSPEPFDLIMRDIGTYDKEIDPNAVAMRHMISLKRKNIVEPNFKMLLYPHRANYPQPQMSWANNNKELTVIIGDTVTIFEFTKDDEDRTIVNVIESSLSTNEFNYKATNIRVFPNPSNGVITIKGIESVTKWKILNTLGQEVYQGIGNSANINNLNTGLYLILTEEGHVTRFMKK